MVERLIRTNCKLYQMQRIFYNSILGGDMKLVNLLFLILVLIYSEIHSQEVDQSVKIDISKLGMQLTKNLKSNQVIRVAICDFPMLDGKLTEFNGYIQQELNTQLAKSNRIEVVEQELVKSALNEINYDRSKPIDQSVIFDIGAKIFASALVFGSITDLGGSIKINARVVATEMGTVISSGSIEISANSTTDKLLGKEKKINEQVVSIIEVENISKEKMVERNEQMKPIENRSSEYFYKEDFSNYAVGDLLITWGKNVVILEGKDKRKYISSQVRGKHQIVQKVDFPTNFNFQFEFLQGGFDIDFVLVDAKGEEFKIKIRQNYGNRVTLPGTVEKKTEEKAINIFKLLKNDKTYKVYINGDFLISSDYPDYSKFVEYKMEIPVGRYFTGFKGKEIH